jgi:hypothetical protein
MRIVMGLLAAAAFLTSNAAVPAYKAKRSSVYTDITGKDCENPMEGELLCPGRSGWRLEIADSGNIIYLRILRGSAPDVTLEIQGRGMGDKVEWRGTRSGASFRADALIIRLRPLEPDEQMSSILHIVKLNAAGACLSAIVDAKGNRNANALARTAADRPVEACEPYPQIFGKQTAATALYGS